jgi:hypothetical protein
MTNDHQLTLTSQTVSPKGSLPADLHFVFVDKRVPSYGGITAVVLHLDHPSKCKVCGATVHSVYMFLSHIKRAGLLRRRLSKFPGTQGRSVGRDDGPPGGY